LLWALTTPVFALYLSNAQAIANHDWSAVGQFWLISVAFSLLAFFAFRLQDGMNRNFSVQEVIDIVEAVLFIELMTLGLIFTLTRLDGIPRSTPLIHGVLLVTGLIATRIVVRIVSAGDNELPDYHHSKDNIILIGANRVAASFIQLLRAYAPRRQPVIALLDADSTMIGRAVGGVQVLAAPEELEAIVSEFAVHGVNTQRVIIAGEADLLSPATLREIEKFCEKRQIGLSFLPRMMGLTELHEPVSVATSLVEERPSFLRPSFVRLKRGIDIVGSLALMILLSPILITASILVLFNVGRPILFWQERLGWNGRSFLIYKFRTLGAPFDSDGNPTFSARQPSAIGRLLRATRIDELPQLMNVLLGDMSLIGPRPLLPEDQPSNKAIRLLVRPGITGWAQVNGGKLISKEEKEKLDEWYVRNASLGVDIRIALMTFKTLLNSRHTSEENSSDDEQVKRKDVAFKEAITAPNHVAGKKRR
jgi:lipopolysaccharide/colanic/teichoic acid biosynthesis glycosyltransferase